MIPLFKVHMNPGAKHRVAEILDSGYIGQGKVVDEFEGALRKWFSWDNLVTVNSATSGIHLCVHMVDKLMFNASPMTCTASNVPIILNGCGISWVDIDPSTLNMDLEKAETSYPSVVPLWAGNSNLNGEFTDDTIVDAAHAFGVDVQALFDKGARFIVFSLQAIKHVTSGDGGVILFRDKKDAERAKLLRWYGIERDNPSKTDFRCELDIKELGFKFHMNDINAAIGMSNLVDAETLIDYSIMGANFYSKRLRDIDEVQLLDYSDDCSYWIYTLLVDRRNDFMRMMSSHGIMTSKVHERNDKHTAFSGAHSRGLDQLESVNERMVSIPVGHWVGSEELEFIAGKINGGW